MTLFHHTFYSTESIAERVGGEVAVSFAPLSSGLVFSAAKACKLCVPIFVFITGYGTPALANLKMTTDLTRYLPALVLGIACSQHRLLEWRGKADGSTHAQALLGAALAALAAALLLFLERRVGFTWLLHTLAALSVCELAVQIERLQGRILAFLGKHSSNMFMCHTFFLSMLLPKQLYSLGHWALIVLSLVSVSLLASVVLEFMKERGGYNALSDHVIQWVNGRVCSPDS